MGFFCWNTKERLIAHVGGVNNPHNIAVQKYETLKGKKNSIQTAFRVFMEQEKKDYKTL